MGVNRLIATSGRIVGFTVLMLWVTPTGDKRARRSGPDAGQRGAGGCGSWRKTGCINPWAWDSHLRKSAGGEGLLGLARRPPGRSGVKGRRVVERRTVEPA